MIPKSFISSKSITIGAGQLERVNITGQVFICKESSAAFQMSMNNGERFDMEVGLGFRLNGDDFFTLLTFYNDTAQDITVQFYAAAAEIRDTRLNNLIERQVAVGYKALDSRLVAGDSTLDADETITIPGTNAGTKRKHLILTNRDTDGELQILTEDDDLWGVVLPRTTLPIETNATLKLHNPNAGQILIAVGEIYYTL